MGMTLPQFLVETAHRFMIDEGDKLVAYADPLSARARTGVGPGDPWTIGIGHTGPEVHEGLIWTQEEVMAAFQRDLMRYVDAARMSLRPGVYPGLSDARKFVIINISYNMGVGPDGWGGFVQTKALLAEAVDASHDPAKAHELYGQVADHLAASTWISQTGNRARRCIAMMRSSNWCSPTGNGSDVL